MRKRNFFLLFLSLNSLISFSQSFYEFTYAYHDSVVDPASNRIVEIRDEYRALVLRNPDGTGLMRVHYFVQDDPAKEPTRQIVEMDIAERYLEKEVDAVDTNTLVVIGSNVRTIMGEERDFTPDNFIFIRNQQGFFEPAFVDSYNEETKTYSHGNFDNVRLLNEEDLTEELVLTYFGKNEDFYKALFETEVRSLTPQQKQTKLFLLLVANTNDKKIGKTCAVDQKNIYDTYKEIAEFLEIPLEAKVISGDEFSKVNVDNAINSFIRPAPNDIVVFYYTGHGFNEDRGNYRFPYLDLRDKSFQDFGGPYTLNMETIFQRIKTKGARLNLVLSDCCNNDPSQAPNMTSEDPETKVSSIGWDKNKCIALFMNPRRMSLLATAAQKGELSAGNISEGGFFTSNFLQSLEKHIGKLRTTAVPLEPVWNSVIGAATNETTVRANRKPCRMPDESVRRCVQHPVSRME